MEGSDDQSLPQQEPEEPARKLQRLWELGQRPNVNKFIAEANPPLTGSQLLAVLRVDQTERWKAGERVPVESYLLRFPAVREHTLDLIYAECVIREEMGETLSLPEYQQRFPDFAESVHALGAITLPHKPELTPAEQPPAELSPAAAASKEQPPPVLPGYEIISAAGGGGMGLVYKARQLDPAREVAIKLIRPEQAEQVNALRRFEREVKAAVRLDHPNIVRFFEASQFNGQHYFVMEYIHGIDLQKLVDQSGVLPPNRACEFVRQCALGLQHAFDRGLVHRDIKPANVMVTSTIPAPGVEPEDPGLRRTVLLDRFVTPADTVIKILDMGLARVISGCDDGDSWSTLTVAGTFMGTPDYMAPEQWENPHATDIRADIYSLGCVLYFLLTGQPPFPGGTMIQKLDKHRSKPPFPVDQLRQGLPARVVTVLGKMLSKRPVERYQSPAEVAAALGDAVQPETLLAKGTQVTILEGTYAGSVGRVVGIGADMRVRVEINLMGRRVPVSVERWMLKPVESSGK